MKKTIKMDDGKLGEELAQLGEELAAGYAEYLVRFGIIDPRGKANAELSREVIDRIFKNIDRLQLIIDHTDSILSHARSFRRSGNSEMASLFYALWFEHRLNVIVGTFAGRTGLATKEVESLVRETSYRAKCSWLLRVLKQRPIDENHTNAICKLMELRNAFVHYKWKPVNEDLEKELESVLLNIEKTVKYVSTYENRYILASIKQRMRKALKPLKSGE